MTRPRRGGMQPSPYTPGEVARQVPGRAAQLAEIDERLAYLFGLQRLVGRIRVDTAARGVGKTSLLREVQRRAESHGALTVWVTAGEDVGLIGALVQEISRQTRDWAAEARGRLHDVLQSATVSLGVPGVAHVEAKLADRPPGASTAGVRAFEDVLRHTVESARSEDRTGVVIFIDEIQSADATGLRTLAYAWQHLQSEGQDLPAAVFAAGLPNSPEAIADVVTFSERFAYRPMDRLTADAAEIALGAPARALRVTWEPGALRDAVEQAQGYPYSLQLIGHATWLAAGNPGPGGRLTAAHLRDAQRIVATDLAALFRARWQKATAGEQELMAAMAGLGDGPAQRADIARALGVPTGRLGVTRARLIDKGLIGAVGHGELEFTIPGFAAFVRSVSGADGPAGLRAPGEPDSRPALSTWPNSAVARLLPPPPPEPPPPPTSPEP